MELEVLSPKHGKYIILYDDIDAALISLYKWYPVRAKNKVYATTSIYNKESKKGKNIFMHNIIMETLGGAIMMYNPESQDYCWREAIKSLQALCDEVVVLDCGSTDGSSDLVREFIDSKTKIVCLNNGEWGNRHGREKLSYFTNVSKSFLSTNWHFCLQADEIIHENSFDTIRKAIEIEDAEGYWAKRINLWCNSQHYLDVPEERKPVGDVVLRLCKPQYQSVDDAQSIDCPYAQWELVDKIRIYHMGFVRNKYVHPAKIKHMFEQVFLMDNDKRVEDMGGVFDCWGVGFTPEDIKQIEESLPIFVQEWAKERDMINWFAGEHEKSPE